MKLLTVWANKKILAHYTDEKNFGRSREIFADDGSLPEDVAYEFEQLLSTMAEQDVLQIHMEEEDGKRITHIQKPDSLEVLNKITEPVFENFETWVYHQYEDQFYIQDRQLAELAEQQNPDS